MKKYFTSIDLVEGKFVATLHDPDTNQIIYKTKPYNSQAQATSDVNDYISQTKTPKNTAQKIPQTSVNTVHKKAVTVARRGCCGR